MAYICSFFSRAASISVHYDQLYPLQAKDLCTGVLRMVAQVWLTCSASCRNFSSIVTPQPLTVNRSCVSIVAPFVDPVPRKTSRVYQKAAT